MLDGNPGWLAIEEYSGNVYVNGFLNSIKTGKFDIKIAAIDRDLQRILATTDLALTVKGGKENDVNLFGKKPLTTLFLDRGKKFTLFIYPYYFRSNKRRLQNRSD